MSIESKLSKFGKCIDRIFGNIKKSISILNSKHNIKPKNKNEKTHNSMTSPYSILLFDAFIAFLSIFMSIHLRVGMDFLDYSPTYILKNMFVFGLVSSSIFLWLQTHQSFWRYTSIEDMPPIFLSVILSNLIFFPLMMLMNQEDFLPYSVLIINVFVLSFMLIIPRFLTKMIYNNKINKLKKYEDFKNRTDRVIEDPQVILIGGNSSVENFLRDVISNENISFKFRPVAILSLDYEDIGRVIKGLPIMGNVLDIDKVLKMLNNDGVFPKQMIITEKIIPENIKKFLTKHVQNNGLLLMHVIYQCTFNTISE